MYAGSLITNVHHKKMPKEKAPCKCLSIIMIDSVIKADKKYYSQTFLEECKYMQEKIVTLTVTLTVALIMRPNLILIMKNSLLKYFNINNKSLIVC